MVANDRTQSLTEFERNSLKTLDRLRDTLEPEVLTVDGQPRAVLISPDVFKEWFDEFLVAQDVASIRRSMREIDEGKAVTVEAAFAEIHARLLALQAAESSK